MKVSLLAAALLFAAMPAAADCGDPAVKVDAQGYMWKLLPGAKQSFDSGACDQLNTRFETGWTLPSRYTILNSDVHYNVDFWTSDFSHEADGTMYYYYASAGGPAFKDDLDPRTELFVVCVR